jgi:dsDNA-specific endonuclease/ATPase MutS2
MFCRSWKTIRGHQFPVFSRNTLVIPSDNYAMTDPQSIQLPIDGTLDLHTFLPNEVTDLVPEYLASCRERGILQIRIIHGKGTGTLRRTVESVLRTLSFVDSFKLAQADAGGWGATIVTLRGK